MAETKTSEAKPKEAQVEPEVTSPEAEAVTAVPTEVEPTAPSEAPAVEAQEPKKEPKKKEKKPPTREEALAVLAGLPDEERETLLDHEAFAPHVQSRGDKKALAERLKARAEIQRELDDGQQIAQLADKWGDYTPDQRQQGMRSVAFNASARAQQTAVDTIWGGLKDAGIVTMSDEDARMLAAQIGNHPNATSEFFVRALKGSVMNRKETESRLSEMVDAKVEERLADLRGEEPTHPELGPAAPPSSKTPEEGWLEAGSPGAGPIYDRYMEWRKAEHIDRM